MSDQADTDQDSGATQLKAEAKKEALKKPKKPYERRFPIGYPCVLCMLSFIMWTMETVGLILKGIGYAWAVMKTSAEDEVIKIIRYYTLCMFGIMIEGTTEDKYCIAIDSNLADSTLENKNTTIKYSSM